MGEEDDVTSELLTALIAHGATVRQTFSDEVKAARRKTLGASEIAAVAGVNPYASMHTVWLAKVHGVEFEGNEQTMLGQLLEPAVVAIYCDRYGKSVTKGHYSIGPEPWISATPDYEIEGEDGLVEAKLVGLRSMWMWGQGNTDTEESDAVPLHYLAQCQWQMLVRGKSFVHLSALMGTEFRSYTIRANATVQGGLLARGRDFWDRYVVTGKEPPVDGSEGAREMLTKLYPRAGGDVVAATPELEELADALLQAREAVKQAEYEKQLRENQFKAQLRDARGAFGNGWRIRYANTKSGSRPFVFEHEREKGKAA